ncbi:P-loop containing nucleoside triphosphate hydrolase protein [Panaeolus papilionaceus]|nr:P-loop containing nucleoside triphosphate hydrolase protein [Panaeolus papilionaceus]
MLSTLTNADECRVMLVSIKAGGTGLNITYCSNVIVLDPWWNPYVEEQAISRVYRLGQSRPVNVFHLIAPNAKEEDIVKVGSVCHT